MYLLPAPQTLTYEKGELILRYDFNIIADSNLGFKEMNYARLLKEQIQNILGLSLPITKASTGETSSIWLSLSQKLQEEEYELIVISDRIEIKGGSSKALLYGIQTLRQIISQKGAVIPCLSIKDYPEILNRGFYHDVTRGRIPKLETLKALADKMSYYKLNQLQLYVEHSFLFKDFSEVWRDDTPLTAEEILELDAYCNSLNIELVPSIASFGHLYKVLSTRTFCSLCELEDSDKGNFSFMGRMEHHTVDVTNENSFLMIRKMLLEFLPLFTSGQFNLCADETFDLGKGKSKALADQIGTDRVYVDFLKKLCEFIKEQGKRPMFWGDIIIAEPEAIKELPQDVICLNWDYSIQVTDTNVKKLYDLGVTQYLCPGVHGWRRMINRLDYAYANIAAMCKYAHQYKAAGILNTDWGDYGHMNHGEFSTSGMIYGAVLSWNSTPVEFDELNKQISKVEYLDSSKNFVHLVKELSAQETFLWESAVQYKENAQKNLPQEEMKDFYQEHNLKSVKEANEKLKVTIDHMYQNMSCMDSSKRHLVKAYLIMAKGIYLLNTLGATIGRYEYGINNPASVNPADLAVELEYWFNDYKEIWRADCKESELYRIQEVIIWYGDFLRGLVSYTVDK